MASLGFTHYNEIPVTPELTVQELIAGLDGTQKTAILNGFILKKSSKLNKLSLFFQ